MDATRKLTLLLILGILLSTTLAAKKNVKQDRQDTDNDDEDDDDPSSRRWDDDILDEDDVKPGKMTRVNVNFRRAGKKPRVRVRGPPLSFPSKSPSTANYMRQPYFLGHQSDPFFMPYAYLTVPRGALKGLGSSPAMTAYGGLGVPSYSKGFVPYMTSLSHQPSPFSTQPGYLTAGTNDQQQQRLLKQLLSATLADDSLKTSAQEMLLANLVKNGGMTTDEYGHNYKLPSPQQQPHIYEEESHFSKSPYPSSSSSSSYSPSLTSSSSSPYSSYSSPPPQYPYPNYPSPFTHHELSDYHNPYESHSHSYEYPDRYRYENSYPDHDSYRSSDDHHHMESINHQYNHLPLKRLDNHQMGSLVNHKF